MKIAFTGTGIASGGGGATGATGAVQSATVTLDAGDLAVLDATPAALVAAPGANKILVPVCLTWVSRENGGFFSAADVPVKAYYEEGGGEPAVLGIGRINEEKTVITDAATLTYDSGGFTTDIINQPIIAIAETGGPPMAIPGAIATSSLNDGGLGYADGDTFTVDGGLGTLAEGVVDSQTAGVVTAYTLTLTPNGYLVATGVGTTATTGIGTGLLIDIDTLDYSANPITLTVKTLYTVMDV